MRYLLALAAMLLLVFTAIPISAQNPTPVPVSTPSTSGMTESVIKLTDIFVPAIVALVVAVGGWVIQSRQFRQTLQQKKQDLDQQQTQFEKKMQLEWHKLQQSTPLESQLASWLGSVEIPTVEKRIGDGIPYIVGPPIVDPRDFYGRRTLVDRFFDAATGKQVTSIEVLGARRSGKTSFLHYISHLDTLHARHHHSTILVYVNLQVDFSDPESFFSYLLRVVMRAFEHHTKAVVGAPNLPSELGYNIVEEFLNDACGRGWRFVLLLDEFEKLARKSDVFDKHFFDNLRALAIGREVAWVTTSFRRYRPESGSEEETLKETSPFFNIFSPTQLYLNAMDKAEATELIVEPARKAGHPFTDEDVDFISSIAGGLPFALQAAASMLYQAYCEGKTGRTAKAQARSAFVEAMEKHFDHYWKHFTPAEHGAFQRLAQAGEPTPEERDALNNLANYGFVEEIDGDYRILGNVFTEWIGTV
jgi:hypothetical protein